MTSKEIIAVFEEAALANRKDRWRQDNLILLSGPGDVVMTGDLHGNERNFDRLINFACLDENPQRHLILHEIIHSSDCAADWCGSFNLLARAAQLKCRYPSQIHFVMANHDMAQFTRNEILKNGQPMVRALLKGIDKTYSQNAGFVIEAMDRFFLSLPLAIRTDNHIWMSHTLPSDRNLAHFSDTIFHLPVTLEMMQSDKSLHALTWDRRHSPHVIEQLSRRWNIAFFIMGHEPQAAGFLRAHERLLILASDHPHGCFIQFELDRPYTPDELVERVRPLAALR